MKERENEIITSIEKELLESRCRLAGTPAAEEQTKRVANDTMQGYQLFKIDSSPKKVNHSDSFKNISINPLQEQLALAGEQHSLSPIEAQNDVIQTSFMRIERNPGHPRS